MRYNPQSFKGVVDARTAMAPIHDGQQWIGLSPQGDEEQYETFLQTAARTRGLHIQQSPEKIEARVDHGRWVADCAVCPGAMLVVPGFRHGICFDCGTHYRIVFPSAKERRDGEGQLGKRPVSLRNWHPGRQKAKELAEENAGHGLPG